MLEIAAAAAAMPLCHWKPECETELAVVVKALDTVKAVLGDYLQGGATRLSPSVLQLLVEASAHPLVSYWPGDEQHDSQVLLSILLTRVFFTCFKIAPDAARAAAIALAAAAFARDTYPGGEKPTLDDDSREKRAVGILQHYRKHQPDGLEMSALFIFGFFGLLPRLIPNDHDMQPADIIRLFKEGLDAHPYLLAYPVGRDMEIRTLPKQFSLVDHAIKPVYGYLASSDNDSDGKLTLASACLLSLSPHWGEDQRIYLIAAIALCRTKSTDHQKLCMKVMNEQQLPREPLESLKSNDDKSLLMQLCQALLDTRAPVVPVAALHFGLLVANIMSCEGSLGDRQSVLRPLLSLCDRTPGCKEPNPLDMGDLLSYLERSVANGPTGDIIQYTMRSIADFCDPDLSLNPGVSSGSGGRTPGPDWQDTLWGLKDGYRTSLEDLKPVGTEELGGFSPVPISAEEPGATPADTETAETSHERDGNAGLK
ncbi:hypothetical protein FRC06_002197 [Ceratobasidium sp. 370]|nr:hypothetical protein FRC06_002197 [Ceratobasidium sp. 370]